MTPHNKQMSKSEKAERLEIFRGSAERDNEPDFEILARHIEQWIQNPKNAVEAREFMQYRKDQIKANKKATGASEDNSIRLNGAVPQSLYNILVILSPNFLGGKEFSPKMKRKRVRAFFKRFPVFSLTEKN